MVTSYHLERALGLSYTSLEITIQLNCIFNLTSLNKLDSY